MDLSRGLRRGNVSARNKRDSVSIGHTTADAAVYTFASFGCFLLNSSTVRGRSTQCSTAGPAVSRFFAKKMFRVNNHLELLNPGHGPDVAFSKTDPRLQGSNDAECGAARVPKANGDQEIDDRF